MKYLINVIHFCKKVSRTSLINAIQSSDEMILDVQIKALRYPTVNKVLSTK